MDYIEEDNLIRRLQRETAELAHVKGQREWFECIPLKPLKINEDDHEHVVVAKRKANGLYPYEETGDEPRLDLGELFMYRNASAADFVRLWAEQGWTTLLVRRTYAGYQRPKFLKAYLKLLKAMPVLGPWTVAQVENDWSYVFATSRPEDIEHFKVLLLAADR